MRRYQGTGLSCPVALLSGLPSKVMGECVMWTPQVCRRYLLWIEKARGKEKTCKLGSVWWETKSWGIYIPHIHWVARQNKLETPKQKDEVNKREVHECDGRARDPDEMVDPPTPKPTRKPETLTRVPVTIVSSCEENTTLRKWHCTHHTQITHPLITRIWWTSARSRCD